MGKDLDREVTDPGISEKLGLRERTLTVGNESRREVRVGSNGARMRHPNYRHPPAVHMFLSPHGIGFAALKDIDVEVCTTGKVRRPAGLNEPLDF